MLRSYFKVALRTLRKQKIVSAVTVGSLAVGLACCLLLFLYVKREWTYDRFHEGADRIFRVVTAMEGPDGTTRNVATPTPLAGALESSFPEVEQTVRLAGGGVTVRVGENELEEQDAVFADSTFLNVFTFPLTHGAVQAALAQPGNVVLSLEAAERYFGMENPTGRRLTVAFDDEERDYRVAGVTEALPANSSIQFDLLLPFTNRKYTLLAFMRDAATTWKAAMNVTYLRLPEAATASALEAKLPGPVKQHYGDEAGGTALQLQPLPAIHLDPSVRGGMGTTSDPLYSYILGGIALLMLLLAGINFTALCGGRRRWASAKRWARCANRWPRSSGARPCW